MDLLATEIRTLGCLIEKQRTTPDAYPLTLNSLRLACNQSTNRDPVVSYEEGDVRDALRRLERRGFVRFASGAGSRAAKYRHRLSEQLPMDDAEQALMCVLMLRGDQTPGELKQRAERLHPFAGLSDVQETLERLIGRQLVARRGRRPGQKEERYAQLLGADATDAPHAPPAEAGGQHALSSAKEQHVRPAPSESYAPAPVTDQLASEAGRTIDGPGTGAGGVALRSAADEAREEQLRQLGERVSRLERELASLKQELGVDAGAEPQQDLGVGGEPQRELGVDAGAEPQQELGAGAGPGE